MQAIAARNSRVIVLAVACWSLMWFAATMAHGGSSWHFFVQGARALADVHDPVRGGLHLYAAAPVLQIGPVALLATMVTMPAGASGALLIWQLLGAAAGVLVMWQIRQIAVITRPDLDRAQVNLRTAAAAVFVMPVWLFLTVHVTHVDDTLALVLTVCAVRAVVSGRPIVAGVLIGLAVDAKPWAVPFACVLLLAGNRRTVVKAAFVAAAVVAVAWLPFFLADPGTIKALRYTIPNTALSSLRVFGVADMRTPAWTRPAQAVLGTALGLLALYRRRWAAVVLLVIAARILLDPGTNKYYVAGVVVGAALWDVVGSRHFVPWWTGAGYALLFNARWFPMPDRLHGWLTFGYVVAAGALVVPVHRLVRRRGASVRTATPAGRIADGGDRQCGCSWSKTRSASPRRSATAWLPKGSPST